MGVFSVRLLVLTFATLLLAGCSSVSGLLGGNDRSVPTAQPQIAVNNELAMPPDLSLAAPGTKASAARVANVEDQAILDDAPIAPVARPAAPTQDVYAQYGISKLNPDGTKKEEGKLREELRQAVLAKKRQQNPRHGTIFNVGELFKE
jgi:hypothetical protein